jgi:hypothetical protein
LPVVESSPVRTSDRSLSALGVVNAQPDAIAVAEIEFAQVAMQVLLGAVLIDAFHAAFEYRKVTFDRVRAGRAAPIFFAAMHDGQIGSFPAHVWIACPSQVMACCRKSLTPTRIESRGLADLA